MIEIDDRYPALFELRRSTYPALEPLADPRRYDQGIAGFLDNFLIPMYGQFVELATFISGNDVLQVERVTADGTENPLTWSLLEEVDTLIVVGSDSLVSEQDASSDEVEALRRYLGDPDRLAFLCPHHNVGDETGLDPEAVGPRQEAEYHHHGDPSIPPRQGFGGLARTLLSGLETSVENRFGLHPALDPDGSPAAIQVEREHDRHGLLDGVTTLNKHPHLPHMERVGDGLNKFDVLARQRIDPGAPPHPVFRDGHDWFDEMIQSRPEVFAGTLVICDTTLFSSTFGGVDNLRQLWTNIVDRKRAA